MTKKAVKQKADKPHKPQMTLIPPEVLVWMARAFESGAIAHGVDNWREGTSKFSMWDDAHERHMALWRAGENIDPKSNIPHLAHAISNLAILLYLQLHGSEVAHGVDDRWLSGNFRPIHNAFEFRHDKD